MTSIDTYQSLERTVLGELLPLVRMRFVQEYVEAFTKDLHQGLTPGLSRVDLLLKSRVKGIDSLVKHLQEDVDRWIDKEVLAGSEERRTFKRVKKDVSLETKKMRDSR